MLPATPQQIKTRYDLALRKISSGQLEQARADLVSLRAALPKAAEVPFQLSRIAHLQGDRAARAAHLNDALALKPDEPALNEAAIAAFTDLGDFAAALTAHDRLIAIAPGDIKRKVDKGLALQFSGDFDAAEKLFRALIRKHPDNGSLYRIFLATKKLPAGDRLIDNLRALLANPRVPDTGKMHASYAMAKVHEDQGATSRVFAHLNRANRLQRAAAPYDAAAHRAEHAAIVASQDGADLTPVGPELPIRPVFVTGMPRSGTTLVEQIISSHSQATAGGELGHALRLAVNHLGNGTALPPLRDLSDAKLTAFARAYTQLVTRDIGATSGVVTDKSMLNHLIYGLLHRALPGARMIVVHRDPRDIAFSIYKNHFQTGTHRYANNLADIAPVIKAFRANAAHWRAVLPPGTLYEVRYEDLVADVGPQSRALIAAAGLEWQDQCLESHHARGTVKTLSLHQVRQPIYQGSAQAWRKYETELAPFIAAWGDDPWD